jgi:hypothetical protein
MTVRVDTETLRRLTKKVRELESESLRLRRENGAHLLKIKELRNTLEGLAYHAGGRVDMTPLRVRGDPTLPGKKQVPIRSDEDVEQIVEDGLPADCIEVELPPSKTHWTPHKPKKGD